MNQIVYEGENLGIGSLGYFFVILSFCAALLGLVSYFFYFRKREETSWRNWGRIAFGVHGIAVVGIFSVLYYLIQTHQFQYHYVWAHTSLTLQSKYIIASFWEGQEGSFLLWTFWHVVLGAILIRTAKSWEAPVMVVLCLTQVMLASMLLGIHELSFFGTSIALGAKIGSNPFILLRDAMPEIPLFKDPHYVSNLTDGRGLNALLQNYWMVIHPPVLFLGFASTVVPFAFAMAGLWDKRFGDWVRPALPWTVFSGMALATGILMGGAWAYESLSFGGFWAWDPVENASLVPWLVMVAGLHCMLIFRARKKTLGAGYIFIILSFLLILYSTFLTRSGVLSETSVHSFTDLGLSGQLLLFLMMFVVMGFASLIIYWKRLPKAEGEESLFSREFWMLVGALVLALSAFQIIFITSIPVINKILHGIARFPGLGEVDFLTKNYTSPTNPIETYHLIQIPIAIAILVLTALGQYFRYRGKSAKGIFTTLGWVFVASIILSALIAYTVELRDPLFLVLLFAACFAAAANADIIIGLVKDKNWRLSGAALAHIGFGLLIAGALVSNGKKRPISLNTEKFTALEDEKENAINKVLFKNRPAQMQEYLVTYRGDSTSPHNEYRYYNIDYVRLNKDGKPTGETFRLSPYAIFDKQGEEIQSVNPDTRHYPLRDIFTHITAASDVRQPEYQVHYDTTTAHMIAKGDTIRLDSFMVYVDDIITEQAKDKDSSFRVTLHMRVFDYISSEFKEARPAFIIQGQDIFREDAELREFGLLFRYANIHPETGRHELYIYRGNRPQLEFITLKAIVFPMINLLWIGCIVMVAGFGVAMARRIREYRGV